MFEPKEQFSFNLYMQLTNLLHNLGLYSELTHIKLMNEHLDNVLWRYFISYCFSSL